MSPILESNLNSSSTPTTPTVHQLSRFSHSSRSLELDSTLERLRGHQESSIGIDTKDEHIVSKSQK